MYKRTLFLFILIFTSASAYSSMTGSPITRFDHLSSSEMMEILQDDSQEERHIEILRYLEVEPTRANHNFCKKLFLSTKQKTIDLWQKDYKNGVKNPFVENTQIPKLVDKFSAVTKIIGNATGDKCFQFLIKQFDLSKWENIKIGDSTSDHSSDSLVDHILRMRILSGIFQAALNDFNRFKTIETLSEYNLRNLAENHKSMIDDYKEIYFARSGRTDQLPQRGYFIRKYKNAKIAIRVLANKIQSFVYQHNDVPKSMNDLLLINGWKYSYLPADPHCPQQDCILKYHGFRGDKKLIIVVSSVGKNGKHEIDYSQISKDTSDFNQDTNNGQIDAGDDIFNVITYMTH